MVDLVVFTQYPSSYAPTRIQEEANKLGLKVKIIGYGHLNIKTKLPDAKNVILRGLKPSNRLYAVRNMCLKHYLSVNSHVLNSDSYLRWSILDKKTQEKEFKKGGISHLKSLRLQKIKSASIKYPIIAKAIIGSHGDHVYKIGNEKELKEIIRKYGIEKLIFQEFLRSGFDLRVIVIDFKVVGIMKRTPRKGGFLSNFSQGGSVTNYIGKDEEIIKRIAVKTAKHFKLSYLGVDLMKGNDGNWKVLEINRACQFKGFEKATGFNVAKEIVSFLIGSA